MNKLFKGLALAACGAALCFCGCSKSTGKSTLLAAPATATALSYSEKRTDSYKELNTAVSEFGATLSAEAYKLYTEGGNFAVSPISAYMALSLASVCAVGETKQELLSALNVSEETLKENFSKLYRSLNVTSYDSRNKVKSRLTTGNSIWMNDNESWQFDFSEEGLEELANDYFCYSYSADFTDDNEAANKAVRAFVKEQTNGLIDSDFELSEELCFALINCLYLKDVWNDEGDDLPYASGSYTFTQYDGTKKDTKLLQSYYRAGRVYEGEDYTTFYIATDSGYRIKFILPDEGASLSEVFTAENIHYINSITDYNAYDTENSICYETRCLFPEFTASYDEYLKDILKNSFGIEKLFNFNECDLSNVVTSRNPEVQIACSDVRQITKLEVNKKGIEGAAVTVVEMDGCGSAENPWTYEYRDFVIDRAFGFILTDSDNIPLFCGTVGNV